jgi:hypothetical protein
MAQTTSRPSELPQPRGLLPQLTASATWPASPNRVSREPSLPSADAALQWFAPCVSTSGPAKLARTATGPGCAALRTWPSPRWERDEQ